MAEKTHTIDVTPPKGNGELNVSISSNGSSSDEKQWMRIQIQRGAIQMGKDGINIDQAFEEARKTTRTVDLNYNPRHLVNPDDRINLSINGSVVGTLKAGELQKAIEMGQGNVLRNYVEDILNNKPDAKKPFAEYSKVQLLGNESTNKKLDYREESPAQQLTALNGQHWQPPRSKSDAALDL